MGTFVGALRLQVPREIRNSAPEDNGCNERLDYLQGLSHDVGIQRTAESFVMENSGHLGLVCCK